VLPTKKYAKELYTRISGPRRGSNLSPPRRALEAGHPISSIRLFGGKVLRFSDLERAIPNITQKMLGQQLRRMETDGIVVRKVYPQVPPKVEYSLTAWGQALCPALDAILKWADLRPQQSGEHNRTPLTPIEE